MTSGLQPSDLIIIAARPSMEDESRAQRGAAHRHQDRHDRRVVQPRDVEGTAVPAAATAEARIDAHRLRGGFLGERDWGRLSQAIGTLSDAKIFIDDTPSIGVLEIAQNAGGQVEHGLTWSSSITSN
jgi:replicative DNA helicase